MPHKRLFSLLAILTLLISLTIAVPIAQGDGPEDVTVPEKQELQYPNLGSHLNQLVASVEDGSLSAQQAAADSPIHSGGSVAVTIHLSGNVDDVVEFLIINGGDPRNVGEDYIEAYVPVTLLGQLSEQPGVTRVQEIVPPEPAHGDYVSQGVQTHLSQAWNDVGYSGQGVKVGVIDLGFSGLTSLMGSELPTNVQGRCYTDIGEFGNDLSDCDVVDEISPRTHPKCIEAAQRRAPLNAVHGTAVAETIIDIAPEVSLYVANPISRADLRNTVEWMALEGVSVINYSVSYIFDGPGDGTSPSSVSPLNTVDQAVASDILWVNSAGNNADTTWFGDYSDPDGDGAIRFGDQNDEIIDLPFFECRGYTIQLRWEDSWDAASTDLDLHLYNKERGGIVFSSDSEQSGETGQIPRERLGFTALADSDDYGLVVTHNGGPVPGWIQLLYWGPGTLEYYTVRGSIGNPAESANRGMLAVGATHYWDTHTIADYSSQGPTPDGRVKPDIVGTACGATASYPHYSRNGQDCWFAGTSQASPHVAGLAALVKQRFPDFTPPQVADYLKDNAEQREAPDFNNTWGHGFAVLPPPDAGPGETGCGPAEIAADGSPVTGTWGAGCESAVREGRHARYYQFTLTESADITVLLESADAETVLYLREGVGATSSNHIGFNEGELEYKYRRASIEESLDAGTYTVEATTYSAGETGGFTLTVRGSDGTGSVGCSAVEIAADGSPAAGTWGSGCESAVREGRHARYYQFTLVEDADITAVLESDDAETVLYLREGAGATSGDHIGFNEGELEYNYRRASIQQNLDAGTYTVEATTYSAGETGGFTLTVRGSDGTGSVGCSAVEIAADGSPAAGTWGAGCESAVREGRHARYYQFTLVEDADITAVLESDAAETVLYLREGAGATSGDHIGFNEGELEYNYHRASIQQNLAAGTYTVEATTYLAGETGGFTLTVSGAGPGSAYSRRAELIALHNPNYGPS